MKPAHPASLDQSDIQLFFRGERRADQMKTAAGRLGSLTTLLYGIGDAANSVRGVLSTLFLLFFYTSVMGLPGSLVGIASGVALVWDALVDPYIGHVSDKARLPLGRRHSFMLIGAAGMGLTTWALFSPPRGLPTAALLGWFLAATLLLRLAGSVFAVPYYALGAELRSDDAGRTAVAAVRGTCSMIAAIAATVLILGLFFPNRAPDLDPKLNYESYPAIGMVMGLVVMVAGLVSTLGTLPSRLSALDSPAVAAAGSLGLGSLRTGAVVAFRYPAFQALFTSFTLIYLGSLINVALLIHFLTYYARVVDSGEVTAVRAAFYGGALAGVPVWIRVARVTEKHKLYALAALAAGLLLLAGFLLVGNGRPLGTGDVRPILLGQALGGLVFSLFWIVPWSMLADITDADAVATGQARQGLFFGIISFGQKLVAGLSVVVVGVLVDGFAGLVPGQAEQSASTVERIGLLASVLPGLLLLCGGFLVLRYPLDRKRVAAVRLELARLRDRA